MDAAALTAAGCNSYPTDVTPYPGLCPKMYVADWSPAEGALDVPVDVTVKVTFSDYPDPDTVGEPSMLLKTGVFRLPETYKVDLAEIDAHMAAHVAFLNKHYASRNFLVSGRKIPRDGGIILAMGKDREQIEAIIQEDPFHAHGLADFRVIKFRASQRADDLPKRIIG